MSPVFLFDMGIIIFVIGSAAGKMDGLFSLGKMSEEVIIQKLGSVIAIEAEQGEGQDFSICLICSRTSVSPLPQTARCSVQPVAMSTQSIV